MSTSPTRYFVEYQTDDHDTLMVEELEDGTFRLSIGNTKVAWFVQLDPAQAADIARFLRNPSIGEVPA